MMKKLITAPIPFYILLLILIGIAGGGFYLLRYVQGSSTFGPLSLSVPDQPITSDNMIVGSWPALANQDFFKKVKEGFIDQKASFIEADLSSMRLKVYENGEAIKEVPILTKGREGSWWETPAGLYKIETREKSHFSSFGQVYQPYSMAFQGNFFIHGWPYHRDGTDVASTYSGGCIRLSTADAKDIFDMVKVGTPVLVYEKDFGQDDFKYVQRSTTLSAQSYLAADLRNNFVFAQKDPTARLPLASITKLVSALIAVEYVDIDKLVTIDQSMLVPTVYPRLKVGQKISVYQLLYLVLNESSDEATVAISRFIGQDRFIRLMNEKAKAIGMPETHFVDATGASIENVSTAQDLFNLAKYLYNNRRFVLNMSANRLDSFTINVYGRPEYSDLKNLNIFADDPDFVGGKVGESNDTKKTIISLFNATLNNAQRPIVVIVLGTDNNAEDAKQLYGWVKNNY